MIYLKQNQKDVVKRPHKYFSSFDKKWFKPHIQIVKYSNKYDILQSSCQLPSNFKRWLKPFVKYLFKLNKYAPLIIKQHQKVASNKFFVSKFEFRLFTLFWKETTNNSFLYVCFDFKDYKWEIGIKKGLLGWKCFYAKFYFIDNFRPQYPLDIMGILNTSIEEFVQWVSNVLQNKWVLKT